MVAHKCSAAIPLSSRRIMKLRLLLLPLLLSLPLAAFAIKANPRPVVVSLPVGTYLLVVPGGSLKVLITAQ